MCYNMLSLVMSKKALAVTIGPKEQEELEVIAVSRTASLPQSSARPSGTGRCGRENQPGDQPGSWFEQAQRWYVASPVYQ